MLRTYITSLIISLSFACTHAVSSSFTAKRFSVRDGLPTNSVNCVTQDNNGYIWIGTSNGLVRYDGEQFLTFSSLSPTGDGLNEGTVSYILKDSTNNLLWLYTPRRTMVCFDISKSRIIDYTGKNDYNKPYRLYSQLKNALWLYDEHNGVRRISVNNGKFSVKDYSFENKQIPDRKVKLIREDKEHNTWIVTNKGFLRIDKNGKETIIAKGENIEAFCENNRNIIYTTYSGDLVVCDYNGKQKIRKKDPLAGKIGQNNSFVFNDTCYFTTNTTTYAIDTKDNKIFIPVNRQMPGATEKERINGFKILSNRKGMFYIFSKWGFKQMQLIPDPIYKASNRGISVAVDKDNNFFIATYGNGLYYYNPKEDKLTHFSTNDKEPIIQTNFLYYVNVDKEQNCWVSTPYGLYLIYEDAGINASYHRPDPNGFNPWSNFVRNIVKNKNGDILLCMRDGRLFKFDPYSNISSPYGKMPACVYALDYDKNGHEWIGTRGAGIFVDGKQYSYPDSAYHIPTSEIFDIKTDAYGRTWIATFEAGLLIAKYEGKHPMKFKQLLYKDFGISRMHELLLDKNGLIWIATDFGICMADTKEKDIKEESFKFFNAQNGKLPFNEILGIKDIGNSIMALATNNGVVLCKYDKKKDKFEYKEINRKTGISNNIVHDIVRSGNNLWIATEEGLTRVDINSDFKESYILGKTPASNNYSENGSIILEDGRILFGTNDGVMILKSGTQKTTTYSKHLPLITDMAVNGMSILTENIEDVKIKNDGGKISAVILPYDQNSINIHFSDLNYVDKAASIFQYYLEGIDKTWLTETSVNQAIYTHLQPGIYIFHLRTMQNGGEWSEETIMRIYIRQPWWNTWWAWLFYLAIAGIIAYYILRTLKRNLALRQQLKVDKQISDFRVNFFTHVSHEFRTPLAIISGTTNKIAADADRPVSKGNLQALKRGVRRMNDLINRLMEFRKLSNNEVRLRVENRDFIKTMRAVYQDCYMIAQQKKINLSFVPSVKEFMVPFDLGKVESITYNLLSNAIKYTPEGGSVELKTKIEGEKIITVVEDNGPGLTSEQEKVLFTQFMNGIVSKGGMGIGLYIAKRLAQIHKGDIIYQRVSDDGGCRFIFTLPSIGNAYNESEYATNTAINTAEDKLEDRMELIQEMKNNPINDVHIAVIEDDSDMMEQISSELSNFFHVDCYNNGTKALAGIDSSVKLIVCDVMMPDMDGFEVVHQLKLKDETEMIPVIMLTALDDDANKLRAIKAGADDYYVKPCNVMLLANKALQLIGKSKKIDAMTITDSDKETKDDTDIKEEVETTDKPLLTSQADKNFLDRIEVIIDQHISDVNFNVDQLADIMKISRTKVYYSVKKVTGTSPNAYIQNKRLKMAAEMILEGRLTVSEISDKVGFQTPAYFTKCFKQHYGVTPTKYREKPIE